MARAIIHCFAQRPRDQRSPITACRRFLALSAASLVVGVGLAGCGESASDEAKRVAVEYATAVRSGDGSTVCGLYSEATKEGVEKELQWSERYRDPAPATCEAEAAHSAETLYGVGKPVPPLGTVKSVTVTDSNATVSFNGPYFSIFIAPVRLKKIAGHWKVSFGTRDTPSEFARSEDASEACITSWNNAVGSGAVVLPKDLSSFAAKEVWASLYGSPCTISLDGPTNEGGDLFYEREGGPWTTTTGYPTTGKQRNVWLSSAGIATPASQAAPDGSVPALEGTGTGSSGSSESPTTTTSSPPSSKPSPSSIAPTAAPCQPASRATVAELEAVAKGRWRELSSLTKVKVCGEWAGATWPAAQPQAVIFRKTAGHWQAVTYGTALDTPGREEYPRSVIEGEP